MMQERYSEDDVRLADIVAADETAPSLGRQFSNGISGVLVLLVTGIVVVLLVLWKAR